MAEPRLYWIHQFAEGNLATMAAPRLDDQFENTILNWKDEGVDVVVSMLENSEIPNLLDAERALCEEFGMEFFSVPIRDKTVPDSVELFADVARQLAERIGRVRAATLAVTIMSALAIACVFSGAQSVQRCLHAQHTWSTTFSKKKDKTSMNQRARSWSRNWAMTSGAFAFTQMLAPPKALVR